MSIIVIRIGDVIMIAPNVATIKMALASVKTKNLAQTQVGKILDQPHSFYAMVVDTNDFTSLINKMAQAEGQQESAMVVNLFKQKYSKAVLLL